MTSTSSAAEIVPNRENMMVMASQLAIRTTAMLKQTTNPRIIREGVS
jgi:hypothetical protein